MNDLENLESLDTDSATIFGLWFGIGGFIVGVLGIGISIYIYSSNNPNVWALVLSGWASGLLVALGMLFLGAKHVKLLAKQSKVLQDYREEITTLRMENTRLIEIDAFVISKAIRTTAKRSTARSNSQSPVAANNVDHIEEGQQ